MLATTVTSPKVTTLPKVDLVSDSPPVIDLLASSEEEIVAQVRAACKRWGFFQIVNHGVDPELRQKFEDMMREFFLLPEEDKLKCERR